MLFIEINMLSLVQQNDLLTNNNRMPIQINEQTIGKASVSSLMPVLKIIAEDYDLNLKNVKQFNLAKRILIHSVNNN